MAPKQCIFCTIAAKKDPNTTLLYESPEGEDDPLVVFRDIRPAAKHHYLVCTKQHIKDASVLGNNHISLVEKMIRIGKQVLHEQGGDDSNARLGFHWPPFTLVAHLHLHVISPQSEMAFMARQIFRPNNWWFVTTDWILNRLRKLPPPSPHDSLDHRET